MNTRQFPTRIPLVSRLAALPLVALLVSTPVRADQPEAAQPLLFQTFKPRAVNKIDIGDFHFAPGQPAPIHTHVAPAFGYVSKGTIYYQVEGQKPQILKAGDAFYEPAGPRILHFDNASKTEEAIFTDINLQREGEPFIVFPTPPKAKIDRRAFPTPTLGGAQVSAVNIARQVIALGAAIQRTTDESEVFYVAEGDLSLQFGGELPIIYHAGETFFKPKNREAAIINTSTQKPANLIVFQLLNPAIKE